MFSPKRTVKLTGLQTSNSTKLKYNWITFTEEKLREQNIQFSYFNSFIFVVYSTFLTDFFSYSYLPNMHFKSNCLVVMKTLKLVKEITLGILSLAYNQLTMFHIYYSPCQLMSYLCHQNKRFEFICLDLGILPQLELSRKEMCDHQCWDLTVRTWVWRIKDLQSTIKTYGNPIVMFRPKNIVQGFKIHSMSCLQNNISNLYLFWWISYPQLLAFHSIVIGSFLLFFQVFIIVIFKYNCLVLWKSNLLKQSSSKITLLDSDAEIITGECMLMLKSKIQNSNIRGKTQKPDFIFRLSVKPAFSLQNCPGFLMI